MRCRRYCKWRIAKSPSAWWATLIGTEPKNLEGHFVDKDTLELQKLQAEVDELGLRLETGRSAQKMEPWKVIPTYVTVLATIIGGTFSYFQQRQQYLDQQEREHKFKLSKEMIDLVQQLNSPSDSMQRNAAVELRFFGPPAVSVLIENLGTVSKPLVRDAIINSLQSIVKSERDQKEVANVLTLIADSVEGFIRSELDQPRPNVNLLLAYMKAMEVAGTGKEASVSKELYEKIRRILLDARKRIQGNTYITSEGKAALGEAISEQLKRLGA
jgi:hypothetical protein